MGEGGGLRVCISYSLYNGQRICKSLKSGRRKRSRIPTTVAKVRSSPLSNTHHLFTVYIVGIDEVGGLSLPKSQNSPWVSRLLYSTVHPLRDDSPG